MKCSHAYRNTRRTCGKVAAYKVKDKPLCLDHARKTVFRAVRDAEGPVQDALCFEELWDE
jgi:hypothetical protein